MYQYCINAKKAQKINENFDKCPQRPPSLFQIFQSIWSKKIINNSNNSTFIPPLHCTAFTQHIWIGTRVPKIDFISKQDILFYRNKIRPLVRKCDLSFLGAELLYESLCSYVCMYVLRISVRQTSFWKPYILQFIHLQICFNKI